MVDREKVKRGLECCGNPESWSNKICHGCPYNEIVNAHFGCEDHLVADALALLKEQEPRVMTCEEVKDSIGIPIWVEYKDHDNWNGYGVPTFDCRSYIMIFGANANSAHYKHTCNAWRCWTSCPTDDQRKAVKWDD